VLDDEEPVFGEFQCRDEQSARRAVDGDRAFHA